MRKYYIALVILLCASIFTIPVTAQEPGLQAELDEIYAELYEDYEPQAIVQETPVVTEEFYKARVVSIVEEGVNEAQQSPYQRVEIEILSGEDKGTTIVIDHGFQFVISENQRLSIGQKVIVNKVALNNNDATYAVVDSYRLDAIALIFGAFFLLTLIFAGRKGLFSIIGLFFSIAIIVYYIVPGIVEGKDPVMVSLIGSLGIMLVSLYLAHGFNRRTTIALGSSLITLTLTVLVANLFVNASRLLGLGSEEAFFLQYDIAQVNLKGLLLGGIIIGVLGVLDDITTAQVAAVYELKRANMKFDFKELYERGVRIGREHIASLVNTLAMAYVGAALPLLLLVYVNLNNNMWVIASSELIVEEIIRTLIGSSALVLAVPITTICAAWYFGKQTYLPETGEVHHGHTH